MVTLSLLGRTYFLVTKKWDLLFVFLYFSYFLHLLLSFYFLIGRKWNWCTYDYPKLSWWVTHVADIIIGHPVVHGKLHLFGEESGLKSRNGAQLTMQSAIYVAIAFYLVSCLIAPTSLCGVQENIFKKRAISFITWWLLTAMNSACRMSCECVIFAGQGLSAVFYCFWKWSLSKYTCAMSKYWFSLAAS